MNILGQAGGTGVPAFFYRDSWLAIEQGDAGNFTDLCFQSAYRCSSSEDQLQTLNPGTNEKCNYQMHNKKK